MTEEQEQVYAVYKAAKQKSQEARDALLVVSEELGDAVDALLAGLGQLSETEDEVAMNQADALKRASAALATVQARYQACREQALQSAKEADAATQAFREALGIPADVQG